MRRSQGSDEVPPNETPSAAKFTIIITQPGDPWLLQETLESLFSQGYPDLECWLCTTSEHAHLAPLQERYPQLRVALRPGCLEAEAVNAAVQAAEGEYLCLLRPGDRLFRDTLTLADELLRNDCSTVGVAFDWLTVDDDGLVTDLERRRPGGPLSWIAEPDVRLSPAMILRCSAVLDAGAVDPAYPELFELDLWLRLACRGAFAVVPRIQACRRHDPSGAPTARDAELLRLVKGLYAASGRLSPQAPPRQHTLAAAYFLACTRPELPFARRLRLLAAMLGQSGWSQPKVQARRCLAATVGLLQAVPLLGSVLSAVDRLRGRWNPWRGKHFSLVPHDA